MNKFYKVEEIAEILNIGARSIRVLIVSGEMKAHKIGGEYRISQEQFEEYLNQSLVGNDEKMMAQD
jgi:excisionase family DNA binding protein